MKQSETGVPGAPYIGKRGPRKTRPPGAPKLLPEPSEEEKALFTEERRAKERMVLGKKDPKKKQRRKRIVIGEGWSAALEKMKQENMTMAEFVQFLTPEELARGRLRNADGSFRGAPARWVPAEFHRECIRELMRRGKEMYQESYIDAIQTMRTIANSPSVEPAQRIKAAQFVIERLEGKVPEKLEIGMSEPWQEMITGIVATMDPSAQPMRQFSEASGEAPDAEG